jgi:hypothetical protein
VTDSLLSEALAALARGWALTPLNGKIPLIRGWQQAEPATETQIREWIDKGYNLGLRTGTASGVFVIDEDASAGGDLSKLWAGLNIPEPRTPSVESRPGNRHLYFRAPDPCPGNSASKLGPHIDTRGTGGQVVFVGSTHPDTGHKYQWIITPSDADLAELDPRILLRLAPPRPAVSQPVSLGTPYGRTALQRELATLASAPEGTRNDSLNRAAFAIAGLVHGGELAATAEADLRSVALSIGLEDREIERTIQSAFNAASPRRAPVRVRQTQTHSTDVLTPGGHTDDNGEHHEIGNDDFTNAVLERFPPGTIYTRGNVPGELIGPPGSMQFAPMSVNRMRILIDQHCRLFKWAGSSELRTQRYIACNADHAGVVLDAAARSEHVRRLDLLVSYPVFLGTHLTLTVPGWNADHRAYYDEPPELRGIAPESTDPERAYALLENLLVDFPWKTDHPGPSEGSSSRDNMIGLLLTPLIRHACDGNVPLHLVLSPIPRAGKTKLAEEILGGVILGKPTSACTFSGDEAEREKRITDMLIRGASIAHLDNIREFLDSSTLASLLTSTTFSGRGFYAKQIVELPNTLTLVASGNNVRATEEIVKRSVPIWLAPLTDEPEARKDFRHPNLREYVRENRRAILEALLGMVIRWRDGDRIGGAQPKGGFESWSSIVGGILPIAGWTRWRTNERGWARAADPMGEDLRAFVEAWFEQFQHTERTASELFNLAETLDVFAFTRKSPSEHGRKMSFSRSVLARFVDAPVGNWIISKRGSGPSSFYSLRETT